MQQPDVVEEMVDGACQGQNPSNAVHIYNMSTHKLVIVLVEELPTRSFRSNPGSSVSFVPTDQYPFIVIDAVDGATGHTSKHSAFYSRNDHSWIVYDDNIIRHKCGSEPPEADQYEISETEGYWTLEKGYKRNRCETIKHYRWITGSRNVSETDSDSQEDDDKDQSFECYSTCGRKKEYNKMNKRLSTFSKPTGAQRDVALLLIDWIKYDNLCCHRSTGAIIRADDRSLAQLSRYDAIGSSMGKMLNINSFRLDLQRCLDFYREFAIQYGQAHFATVFLHENVAAPEPPDNEEDNILRNAFEHSLSHKVEVWISKVGGASPQDADKAQVFEYLFGPEGKHELYAWKRAKPEKRTKKKK